MNRRNFLTKASSLAALTILPTTSLQLWADDAVRFERTPDGSGLQVSFDDGQTFQHSLSLGSGTQLSEPKYMWGAYHTKIQDGLSNAFNLYSTDGLHWHSV